MASYSLLVVLRMLLLQTVLVFKTLAKDGSSLCGNIGQPRGVKSVIFDKGTYTYQCLSNTFLLGDRQRKCVNGQFTSSTPVCMPVYSSNDLFNSKGTGLDLINNNKFVCSKHSFKITFAKTFIRTMFVWTDQSCDQLSIETDHGTYKQHSSSLSTNNSLLHSFTVNNPVKQLSINQSCCLYRVVILDSSIAIRCGSPDMPPGVELQQFSDKIVFSCHKTHKLEGPSSSKCIGLEKWSHQGKRLKCVPDNSSTLIIIFCSLLIFVLLIFAFCLGMWYISKAEVEFDPQTLSRQMLERYKGVKAAPKDVTLMKPLHKDGFCTNYTALFQSKEVLAHVCDLTLASASNIPVVEQARCQYAAVMFDFNHPNLLSVLALSTDAKNNPILVFEMFSNGSLDTYVSSKKKLSQKDLLALCLDVCNGMIYLSQRRIVHRNLQAKNCYVDDTKKVKIGNFKLCQELGNYDQFLCKATVERERMPWAAPETVAENMSSVASDVWSFGVLIWEVFSDGQEPYLGMSDVQITTFLLDEQRLSKPVNCPDKLYALMLDCWKTDADQRPTFSDLSSNIQTLAS